MFRHTNNHSGRKTPFFRCKIIYMKLDVFGCEDWLNVYETKATYDISQSTMSSLTMDEFLDICQIDKEEFYSYINSKKMNYGHIEGSPEFKEQV